MIYCLFKGKRFQIDLQKCKKQQQEKSIMFLIQTGIEAGRLQTSRCFSSRIPSFQMQRHMFPTGLHVHALLSPSLMDM